MSSAVQEIDRLEAEIRDAYERVRRAKRRGIQGSELNTLVKDFEAKQRIWLEFIEKPVDKDWS